MILSLNEKGYRMFSLEQTTALLSLIFLFFVALFTANYAEKRGRNPIVWFGLSLLIGLFAPLILWLLPTVESEEKKIKENTREVSSRPLELSGEKEKVPHSPLVEKLWYYLDQHHQQYGPVSLLALRELWNTGRLELTSYVWTEGMANWEIVDHLPELKEELSKAPDYTL